MTYQEIKTEIGESHGPFEFRTADGRVHRIRHSKNMAFNPSAPLILYFGEDGKRYNFRKADITELIVVDEANVESN